MGERIRSFDEFWPYYLNEHRDPTSRRLHFVGTTAWLTACAGSAVLNPLFVPAAAGMAVIGRRAAKREGERRSLRHVAAMVALPTLASPILFPAGVVAAYGCAWAGHFGYEKNRPATFQYPVWSLTSDLRMWSHMARGKLWSGTDPAAEVGAGEPVGAPA